VHFGLNNVWVATEWDKWAGCGLLSVIVHAYASVAVNERRTYSATQEGCHNIYFATKCKGDVQTFKAGRAAILLG